MTLDRSNSSSLEQLALKGLRNLDFAVWIVCWYDKNVVTLLSVSVLSFIFSHQKWWWCRVIGWWFGSLWRSLLTSYWGWYSSHCNVSTGNWTAQLGNLVKHACRRTTNDLLKCSTLFSVTSSVLWWQCLSATSCTLIIALKTRSTL